MTEPRPHRYRANAGNSLLYALERVHQCNYRSGNPQYPVYTNIQHILLEPIIEVDGRVDELHARVEEMSTQIAHLSIIPALDELHARLDNGLMECRNDHEEVQKSMQVIDSRVDQLESRLADMQRLFDAEKEQRARAEASLLNELSELTTYIQVLGCRQVVMLVLFVAMFICM